MASSIVLSAEVLRWFVFMKLLGETDYDWWLEPTICKIESHGMKGLNHVTFKTPKENGDSKKNAEDITVKCKRSDALVTGKVSASLNKYVMTTAVGFYMLCVPTKVSNELVVGSEDWMKKIAESYTITVALHHYSSSRGSGSTKRNKGLKVKRWKVERQRENLKVKMWKVESKSERLKVKRWKVDFKVIRWKVDLFFFLLAKDAIMFVDKTIYGRKLNSPLLPLTLLNSGQPF
ncbi:hypothetical protein L2E82_30997 [Cichorium intybus]|uniref:Uncharacterized protein n=1 Tax=Cichorium intybus TaxID=13427 RepID=A0ACB9D1R8_CICIN|nr:hypothetical protein L2E82_30997 [Cichorium intybus]